MDKVDKTNDSERWSMLQDDDCNTRIKKKNFMVWVRERTIPTDRPPLVGEVIANFCG
jgi:hypothetical protein